MDNASRTSVAPSFEIKLLYHDTIRQLDFLNTQQLVPLKFGIISLLIINYCFWI